MPFDESRSPSHADDRRAEDGPVRVVVTGLGAVTPLGTGVAAYWDGLVTGRSGIGPITAFDASALDCRIAGQVPDFDPLAWVEDRKEARRLARFSQFAIAASKQALADAGLPLSAGSAERLGVCIGSGMGGLGALEEQFDVLRDRGPGRVSPFTVPMMITNMAAGNVAIAVGARGPNTCPVTACASGTHAIGEAFEILRRGAADAMLAGGAEAVITPMGIAAFASARALSTRNDDPSRASRPFDRLRDGFVMGEGAGVVLLETLAHARARGARIYAELTGWGMTCDAHHMTAPSPDGAGIVRAMAAALTQADVAPTEVGYLNAHGTSTPLNDAIETEAVKAVFGAHAPHLPVSSVKSMTGHLLGAAGGVEAIATVLALHHGLLPPTINLEEPDPACDLDYVPNVARVAAVEVAMSNSMGFGGHNASLIFRRAR
ncbi:MAG: beta-ketoacyl-ACP synthase II [Candidatus Sericytochromatia bacterium]|nr:beta-ketoacyl-ACP synthase II [Candidatus Sericytochromatia bacterium]